MAVEWVSERRGRKQWAHMGRVLISWPWPGRPTGVAEGSLSNLGPGASECGRLTQQLVGAAWGMEQELRLLVGVGKCPNSTTLLPDTQHTERNKSHFWRPQWELGPQGVKVPVPPEQRQEARPAAAGGVQRAPGHRRPFRGPEGREAGLGGVVSGR